MKTCIDINADLGELSTANDAALMPYLSSASIACGFHAGSPERMQETVALCLQHGVAIGAHPSYRDRAYFGRRETGISAEDIYAISREQIEALRSIAQAQNTQLRHVKAHGALYNRCATDVAAADALARAVHDSDSSLILVGLANSEMLTAGRALGLRVVSEGFADRRYTASGHLQPRTLANALIDDESEAIAQVLQMLEQGTVKAVDGSTLTLGIDTVCVHGDGPQALAFVQALHGALTAKNIRISSEYV